MLLIAVAGASALVGALAFRRTSLVATLLCAYLLYTGNLGAVTLALSPFREVTPTGLWAIELSILAAALGAWWLRGHPVPPLAAARSGAREILGDPVTAALLAVVALALGYELVLALSVPPNNMDSLTYHLVKAASWAQHGGYYWIPNAPELEINDYQPLAEQQNLFLMVATGGGSLFALPQYLAELAVLVAAYGSSRRLGFAVRPSAFAALLLATFSVFALEAMTGQNDLVAASFAAVAGCLILGEGLVEPALAGVAVAFGLGTKLTTGLAIPFLLALALLRGRRTALAALAGALAGFVTVGMWGYVLDTVHTGSPLGAGSAYLEHRASPSYPGSVANVVYLVYGLMDLSVFSNRLIDLLAALALLAAFAAAFWAWRRGGPRRALGNAAGVAVPLLAPLLVLAGAGAVAFVARVWGFPIRGRDGILTPLDVNLNEVYTRFSNEDYSAYGPLGIVALLSASALALGALLRRRADRRQLVLVTALPGFLVLLALQVWWAPFLIRFFMIPAALAAPLLAHLFGNRARAAAFAAVAALSIGLTLTRDQSRPLESLYGWAWQLDEDKALYVNSDSYVANALDAYDELVPAHACVGAVIGDSEPSYLLYGPRLEHHVVFLSVDDAVLPALRMGLFYVVISAGADRWVAARFRADGWRIRPLGQLWLLASEPSAAGGDCLH